MSAGCNPEKESNKVVVVYTSVDQHHAEPILDAFEKKTGIEVKAVFDVEAAKTTGLVNRLIAEKNNPQADVFWNSEFAQTILLKEKGILAPYESPSAADIPTQFRDPEHYWAGISGRARIFIINTDLVAPENYPENLDDYLNPEWPADKIAIASPLFGTSATHAAALYSTLGNTEALDFFVKLEERGVRIESGNSTVRDLVASGDLMWGLTDTDDAAGAIERGAPVDVVFPEQGDDGLGTLLIPTTAALIAGSPHEEEGKKLVDFLLSVEVEKMLIESGWCHVPVREIDAKPKFIDVDDVKLMDINLADVYKYIELVKNDLRVVFVK
jgi:iron(III) transport system substrate-binding protein